MIEITYGATFSLDDALKPLNDLFNMQKNEPKWYWLQRTNILHRMEQDLQDDIEKCDPRIDEVMFNHMNWASASFVNDSTGMIRFEARQLQAKIQACIDKMIAEYPVRLKSFHDDLLHDGEEIPVDVYQP